MFFDLLKKRRSIRRFTDHPIEKEKIDGLMKAALLSPSSRGIRPWEFVVVDDRETLTALSQCKPHGASFLKSAALGIAVVADPSHATGIRSKVVPMARAAVAAGADGLIVEVHPDPPRALSDGAQSLYFEQFDELMEQSRVIARAIGRDLLPGLE